MLNVYSAEIMKTKRNRVFWICLLIAVLMPVLIIVKDRFAPYSIIELLTQEAWVLTTLQVSLLLLYPVLSGFIITNIMQREYTEQTIKGNMTAPMSRTVFFFGKLLILATWQLLITVLCATIVLLGVVILFPGALLSAFAIGLLGKCLFVSTLSFLSFLPVMSMAILQRRAFYPSLIACLIFVFLASLVNVLPPYLVNVCPWSAVLVYHLTGTVYPTGMLSIALCGMISVIVSIVAVNKQDL